MSEVSKHVFDDFVREGVHISGAQIWRPSVPEPFWVGFGFSKAQCVCGRKFRSAEDYRNHYIYEAVWQNESGYIPRLISEAELRSLNRANDRYRERALKWLNQQKQKSTPGGIAAGVFKKMIDAISRGTIFASNAERAEDPKKAA